MNEQEKQKSSLVGSLFSMVGFLFLMGIVFLVSGYVTGQTMQLFWGLIIVGGSVALHFVRKKDWQKHWEEQDQFREKYQQNQERLKLEKEKTNDAGK